MNELEFLDPPNDPPGADAINISGLLVWESGVLVWESGVLVWESGLQAWESRLINP